MVRSTRKFESVEPPARRKSWVDYVNYGHDYGDDDDHDDNSDTWGMNDIIFRSTNINYNQHHDISHLLELHDTYDNVDDNYDDSYDHDKVDYKKVSKKKFLL